jgi:hypothetical protein
MGLHKCSRDKRTPRRNTSTANTHIRNTTGKGCIVFGLDQSEDDEVNVDQEQVHDVDRVSYHVLVSSRLALGA